MPTIVNIKLRWDDHAGRAAYDDVDLDQLTPRARTLAEAVALASLRSAADIWMESDRTPRETDPNWRQWYTEEEASRPERRAWRGWAKYPSGSTVSPAEYLEREARKIPPHWHVLGPHPDKPVPSKDAGAADRHLSLDGTMAYLRARGAGVSPAAWDLLIGTGILPTPDRYVCGQPQWMPETLDDWVARQVELWTPDQVADFLGYTGPSAAGAARKQLYRWGITPSSREPGRAGRSLYPADQVRAAQAARPGRGARTDLNPSTTEETS